MDWHFCIFNVKWLFLHQMDTAFKSDCNSWQSLRLDIERNIFRLSAKRSQTQCFTTSGKSLMKSRKRTGPRWLSWWTNFWNLFIKYEDIHERICELNPIFLKQYWMIDFVKSFSKIRINDISLQSMFKIVKNVITEKC